MKILSLLKLVVAPILPAGTLLTVVLILLSDPFFHIWNDYPWLTYLPVVLLGSALLLGLCFRQFRISLISLLLLAAVLRGRTLFTSESAPDAASFILLSSIVLPLATTTLNLQKERQPFSRPGLIRLAVVLSVGAALYVLPGTGVFEPVTRGLTGTWRRETWRLHLAIPPVGVAFLAASAASLTLSPGKRVGALVLQSMLFAFLGLNAGAEVYSLARSTGVFAGFMSCAAMMLVWTVLHSAWRHAYVDELTGLPGRRPMQQHFASLGSSFAIAVVDLDHFKKVNDRYGHDVGDQVLRFLASELKSTRLCKAYRFGGEEFVLVFERGTFEEQTHAAEDLRQRVEERQFVVRGPNRPRRKPEETPPPSPSPAQTIDVTVSIGIARGGGRFEQPEDVLRAADKVLYRAKKAGRNRISRSKV